MNITSKDLFIVVSMSLAVILMSFIFPALGMSNSDSATSSEIPEFNVTADRFQWAGEYPTANEEPVPTEGTLVFNSTIPLNDFGDESHVWLHGDEQTNGVRLVLTEAGPTFGDSAEFRLQDWSTTPISEETVQLENVSEGARISNFSYTLDVQFTNNKTFTADGQTEVEFTGTYKVIQQDSDESFLTRVPIVGAVVSGAEALAGVVAWGFTIFWWYSAVIVTTVLNAFGVIVDGSIFIISLFHWLFSTYFTVVSSANSFSSVFLAIPGVLLGYELLKMVFIIIDIIWIG